MPRFTVNQIVGLSQTIVQTIKSTYPVNPGDPSNGVGQLVMARRCDCCPSPLGSCITGDALIPSGGCGLWWYCMCGCCCSGFCTGDSSTLYMSLGNGWYCESVLWRRIR